MKKTLLLLLLIITTISTAQESTLLRLKYSKGDVYQVKLTSTQEMGETMSVGVNIEMGVNITAISDDTFTSEMKFTKMTMDMLQGGQVMSFDSSKSDDELDGAGKMLKAQMAPMLASIITLKTTNLGEVLELKSEPNVPGISDFANQSSNVIYPVEAVKVGSTWSFQKEDKGMILDYEYKVKAITADKVELDVTGKASGIANGTITGTMLIDSASGVPLSSVLDMRLTMQGLEMLSKISMTTQKM